MTEPDVTEKLRDLVTHYGISAVRASLTEIISAKHASASKVDVKSRKSTKPKPTAAKCVERMELAPQKVPTLTRAAELYDEKRFLPAVADIKEFSRVYDLKLPKSVSRASAIPRVFSFLASMDNDRIERTLKHAAFRGPAHLAPIADAIRNHAESRRSLRRTTSFVE